MATITKKKNEAAMTGETSSPPKPPSLVLLSSADLEAAAQMCEHEWMSHTSGMREVGKVREERRSGEGGEGTDSEAEKKKNHFIEGETTATTTPKPPVVAAVAPSSTLGSVAAGASALYGANGAASAAPRGVRQQQFAEQNGAIDGGQASSPPLPSTPSTSSEDEDEALDLVPEQRRGTSFRGGRRGFPLTSPAVSDGGGLRDEHVEDPWSDDDSESENGESGDDGDNERSASGAGGGNSSGTPRRSSRRSRKKLGGGRGGEVRRALLPSSSNGNDTLHHCRPPPKEREKTPRSLRSPGRHFTVVTTASLPWMTGTSVNPTLRSAYLARALPRSSVTLMLPWLPGSQQGCVFPKGVSFESPQQQEAHVREWIRQRTGFDPPGLKITWYHARYCPVMKSIFPYGGKRVFFSFFVFGVFFFLFLSSFRLRSSLASPISSSLDVQQNRNNNETRQTSPASSAATKKEKKETQLQSPSTSAGTSPSSRSPSTSPGFIRDPGGQRPSLEQLVLPTPTTAITSLLCGVRQRERPWLRPTGRSLRCTATPSSVCRTRFRLCLERGQRSCMAWREGLLRLGGAQALGEGLTTSARRCGQKGTPSSLRF